MTALKTLFVSKRGWRLISKYLISDIIKTKHHKSKWRKRNNKDRAKKSENSEIKYTREYRSREFFENPNKMDKPLVRLIKKREQTWRNSTRVGKAVEHANIV